MSETKISNEKEGIWASIAQWVNNNRFEKEIKIVFFAFITVLLLKVVEYLFY
ncbi:MAG: hypothetical protein V3U19_02230 [Thermodesulfobacteriota bacterium]